MKYCCALLMVWCLMASCAFAHEVDIDTLTEGLAYTERQDLNGVDTIYRPEAQPWIYETETGDLRVYLDYVDIVNEDLLALRMTLNFCAYDELQTQHVSFAVGNTAWIPMAENQVQEYDGSYYHDYLICFTDESFPLLKAMIQAEGQVAIHIDGLTPFDAEIVLPAEELADLYDRYVNAGGTRQHFDLYNSMYPTMIRKLDAK